MSALQELADKNKWNFHMMGGYYTRELLNDDILTQAAEELAAYETLLTEAIQHLEWCGYGDSYERESARNHKLPQRLEAWLERAGDTHK